MLFRDTGPASGVPRPNNPNPVTDRTPTSGAARALALDRLLRLERDGAYVSRLPDGSNASGPDERRAADYVAGVTRHRRWLDYLIGQFYRGDSSTLEPRVRQVLRIGLYDLLVKETAPHAAVGEAVELAKRAIRVGAGGLVNGVLRSGRARATPAACPSRRPATRCATSASAIRTPRGSSAAGQTGLGPRRRSGC